MLPQPTARGPQPAARCPRPPAAPAGLARGPRGPRGPRGLRDLRLSPPGLRDPCLAARAARAARSAGSPLPVPGPALRDPAHGLTWLALARPGLTGSAVLAALADRRACGPRHAGSRGIPSRSWLCKSRITGAHARVTRPSTVDLGCLDYRQTHRHAWPCQSIAPSQRKNT